MKLLGRVTTRGVRDVARTAGKRGLVLVAVLLLGGVLAVGPLTGATSASAATAFNQCSSIDNTPGLEVACTVTVTNRLNLVTGVTSSTTSATVCLGAAGTTPNGACTTTTSASGQLVTSVSQCNAAANGGGGNVICSVAIVNDVLGAPRLLGVTVNECIGSGTGGGANPLLCYPVQGTTGATITQCNGSVNGGGADGRVLCTVTGATSAIAVLVNQCNGSVNGGGSTAKCAVSFTNNLTAAPVTTPTGGTGTGSGAAGSGAAGSGTTGAGGSGQTSSGGGSGSGGSAVTHGRSGALTGSSGNLLAYTGVDVGSFVVLSLVALLAGGTLLFLALWRKRARRA